MIIRQKNLILSSLTLKRRPKRGKGEKDPVAKFFIPSERVSNFSLGLRAIGPSEFFRARSKAALREEDNA